VLFQILLAAADIPAVFDRKIAFVIDAYYQGIAEHFNHGIASLMLLCAVVLVLNDWD